MQESEFADLVDKHSLCPKELLYNSNALAGESGEVANCVKKMQMASKQPDWVNRPENALLSVEHWRVEMKMEMSDQLFYMMRICNDHGWTLGDLMKIQAEKLASLSDQYKCTFRK